MGGEGEEAGECHRESAGTLRKVGLDGKGWGLEVEGTQTQRGLLGQVGL